MAHVILFEHAQFHGQHKHVFGAESNLNAADDNYFNDKVSSLVVLEGNWAVFADHCRQAANYVDQILKGAKPADLPVQLPTEFELTVNSKTAKALGLTIPSSIVLSANIVE